MDVGGLFLAIVFFTLPLTCWGLVARTRRLRVVVGAVIGACLLAELPLFIFFVVRPGAVTAALLAVPGVLSLAAIVGGVVIESRESFRAWLGWKGWLAGFRDATLFKVIYGWGLRRREAAMLDVADFAPNPAAPELGSLGVCHVRFGKAMRGSPPRRRVVATVMPWAAQALEEYLAEVRPRYGCDAHPAVWLTERAARISARQVDDRFAQFRALAGLPAELSVHCLRHSYVSHLIEDGVDPLFVQQQVGHSWASTTAIYTTVGADARNRMLRSALSRAYDNDGGGEDGGR